MNLEYSIWENPAVFEPDFQLNKKQIESIVSVLLF